MSRDTVEQIIGRFGSQQRVAELLGIWQTAVSGWVRRGEIPAKRQAQLLIGQAFDDGAAMICEGRRDLLRRRGGLKAGY